MNYIGVVLEGRYKIIEQIGRGGMADVFKAEDMENERTVAIKIFRDEFSQNAEFLRRFRNESKAIAVLSHPNIVKIFDMGLTNDIKFIVMEYIDGMTLKDFIGEQGVLRWKDALFFITQILRALQHAHDKGVVHRDIKPQNIMILEDGTIKVMDFGIPHFSLIDGKTMFDKSVGSVDYFSPEQARGDISDVRSDIYSVGVILYEMVTGRKPFNGDTPIVIALKHMQEKCVAPREIMPSIPEAIEEIILHAMEKDPNMRYQTAANMIADIDTFKHDPTVVFGYTDSNYGFENSRQFKDNNGKELKSFLHGNQVQINEQKVKERGLLSRLFEKGTEKKNSFSESDTSNSNRINELERRISLLEKEISEKEVQLLEKDNQILQYKRIFEESKKERDKLLSRIEFLEKKLQNNDESNMRGKKNNNQGRKTILTFYKFPDDSK